MKKSNQFLDALRIHSEPINTDGEFVHPIDSNDGPKVDEKEKLLSDLRTAKQTPKMELSDLSKSIMEKEEKKDSDLKIPESLIVAGIPMVISAMMGDVGTGAGIAGKAITERDAEDREYTRKIASSGKEGADSLKEYYDPETKEYRWGRASKIEGEVSPTTETTINKYKEKRETTDELTRERLKDLGKLQEGSSLNYEQRKATDQYRKNYEQKIKKNEESMRNIEDAITSIGKGEFGDKIGFMRAVKTVEQRLSDADRAFYISFINRLDAIREQVRRIDGNSINPKLLSQAKQVLSETIKTGARFNKYYANRYANDLNEIHGVDKEFAVKRFEAYSPSISKESEYVTVTKDGKTGYRIKRSKLNDAKKEGYNVVDE